MTKARRHHFLPEFYLAGFTPSGTRRDSLWVADREEQQQYLARPRKVANQRDFYQVNLEGVEPDFIEKELGKFEHRAAGVIARIVAERELPSGEDRDILITFIALLAVRIPAARQQQVEFNRRISEILARTIVSSRETFDTVLEQIEQALPPGLTLEDVKAYVARDDRPDFQSVTQTELTQRIISMGEPIGRVLAARSWSLVFAGLECD